MGSPAIGYLEKVAPSSKSYGLRSNLLLKVRMYVCIIIEVAGITTVSNNRGHVQCSVVFCHARVHYYYLCVMCDGK